MDEQERAIVWAAGAFSAYGIARRRGRVPSMMIGGFTRELPARLIETLKLGRIEAGAMPRWVCDSPNEYAAFYRLVGPHLIESRRQMIEDAWATWRGWKLDKDVEDPGEIEAYGHAEVQERRQVRAPVSAERWETTVPRAEPVRDPSIEWLLGEDIRRAEAERKVKGQADALEPWEE